MEHTTPEILIEEIMKSTKCTRVEAISGLQSAAAKTGYEELLEKLCELKEAEVDKILNV